MDGEMLLKHAAAVVAHRRTQYGEAPTLFDQVATRWSLVLGIEVTPERVALCVPQQQDEEARRLLEKECEIMASLQHSNIVGMYGIEDDEETFLGSQVVAQLLKCSGGFGENSGGFNIGIRICGFSTWKNTIDLTKLMLSFGNGAL